MVRPCENAIIVHVIDYLFRLKQRIYECLWWSSRLCLLYKLIGRVFEWTWNLKLNLEVVLGGKLN